MLLAFSERNDDRKAWICSNIRQEVLTTVHTLLLNNRVSLNTKMSVRRSRLGRGRRVRSPSPSAHTDFIEITSDEESEATMEFLSSWERVPSCSRAEPVKPVFKDASTQTFVDYFSFRRTLTCSMCGQFVSFCDCVYQPPLGVPENPHITLPSELELLKSVLL